MSDALLATTTLIPFLGHGHAGAAAWIRMDKAERRRLAMAAARGKGAATLWSLTEAWVRTYTRAGAGISEKTVQGYRVGVQALLAAWTSEDLLHPDPDAAAWYVRHLQQSRLTPGTIGKRLAARGFYATLRWARASLEDPFRDIHTPHDPIPRGRSAGPMMPRRLRPCSSRRAIRATGCWCCWGRMTGYAPARAWSCAGAGPGAAGGAHTAPSSPRPSARRPPSGSQMARPRLPHAGVAPGRLVALMSHN